MKKRTIAMIMCILLLALSGCGQEESIKDRHRDREQRAEGSSDAASDSQAGEELFDGLEGSEEDPLAIYQCFLVGEEPLYFREDTYFDSFASSWSVEAGRPYEFYEVCNIVNMASNYSVPVNELSNNISYAYIDCGADGNMELALYFHDLMGQDGSVDMTMIIKNVNGRLEMCYKMQSEYREVCELSNVYGLVCSGGSTGASTSSSTLGLLDEDAVYNYLYTEDVEYDVFGSWSLDFYFPGLKGILADEIPADAIVLMTYSFQEYNPDQSYDDYFSSLKHSLQLYDQMSGSPLTDEYIGYKDILDDLEMTGMGLYSYEEIQTMLADREASVGLTEEIKNGAEVEWIPIDDKGYDLIYGVKSASGVSDKARTIEAFRRFLSDKGHFKEALGDPMNDGLAVNNDGMIDGFFIKDMDRDDIPELLIGMSDAGRSQYVFVYKFDKESGRVKKDHVIYSLGGWFGCDEETYDTVVAVYPEFEDSLLFTDHYANGRQQVGYNDFGQLVWFDNYAGISLATDIIMYWCDYESIGTNISQYTEDGGYDPEVDLVYYEVTGSRPEAEKALQGYRPFLFYDINQENIDKYLVEDYLEAGMEQYSQQDVTDDRNQFYRLYEEYVRGEDLSPTGIFAGQYSAQKYNIDKLVQLGFDY